MKYITKLLLTATLALVSVSCNTKDNNNNQISLNNDAEPDLKTEVGKINNLLKKYEEPSQLFKVASNKPSTVKGKKGTVISINPADLITENGQQPGKTIEVELKELTNQSDLLRTNAQTVSNGKQLVSGGAYFINLTSGGQQLKLKKNKTLSVAFPKLTNKEMQLFYAQRDSLGQLDWQLANQKFENKPKPEAGKPQILDSIVVNDIDAILDYTEDASDRTSKQRGDAKPDQNQIIEDKVYETIQLKQFGWINCDRFYEVENKTNLNFAFNEKDNVDYANVYLVFKDINSVMTEPYFTIKNKKYNSAFIDIPVGAKTQLIAISIKDGKTYSFKSDLIITKNQTINLTLTETNEKQINKLFQ
ncbi:hypothetical protein NAT51_13610 [Flavobacterium amniphilum]|uniref:hypothetical protein n=1 Tax=Flavobacterium amniphilum TaxID=1834035 RepID=UPI00202A7396|nr:hypothetical protein [Flavobacterium amniphilum]MCL9806567.1 hypothetical protein [Flavobacterium amniphilum]